MTIRFRYHVATVQLAIDAETQIEAIDAISSALRTLEAEGMLLDWGYLKVGGQQLSPTPKLHRNLDEYKEGDFLP